MSKKEVTKKEVTKEEGTEIEVSDPAVLRPKELPLAIKPKKGGWDNEEQARYAANLNAYIYKNPDKWEVKKESLLAKLKEIGKNPSQFGVYAGRDTKLSYKNELVGEVE